MSDFGYNTWEANYAVALEARKRRHAERQRMKEAIPAPHEGEIADPAYAEQAFEDASNSANTDWDSIATD